MGSYAASLRTYWSCWLGENFRHTDERLVEVLDGLGGIFWRPVPYVADAASREVLDVCDRELGEVFAHILL